ncbi:hypothetical protein MKX73_14060 [Solibacillus sp. FSL W7-1436]|uniref:AraC family transcriptional regulator n=1 Tax=Solibacillus palustris TaxID=2908203 RepID=A0ABS9UB40_9BACL|nr:MULTISPECIES: hypothetical protein [Solibacillus]MCH7321433.1 hypothetical protein [Solibacillus sp. MA9]MCM3721761.1 hypothetical protein [Solibacillus isronensis]
MSKKWTIHSIREYVEKNTDTKLLSTEFKGFSQKLDFQCACGNTFQKPWKKFKENKQQKCEVCQPPKESR